MQDLKIILENSESIINDSINNYDTLTKILPLAGNTTSLETNAIAKISMESISYNLGYKKKFEGSSVYNISTEDIKSKLIEIWEAIVKYIKKIFSVFKEYYDKEFSKIVKFKEKLEELDKKFKNIEYGDLKKKEFSDTLSYKAYGEIREKLTGGFSVRDVMKIMVNLREYISKNIVIENLSVIQQWPNGHIDHELYTIGSIINNLNLTDEVEIKFTKSEDYSVHLTIGHSNKNEDNGKKVQYYNQGEIKKSLDSVRAAISSIEKMGTLYDIINKANKDYIITGEKVIANLTKMAKDNGSIADQKVLGSIRRLYVTLPVAESKLFQHYINYYTDLVGKVLNLSEISINNYHRG